MRRRGNSYQADAFTRKAKEAGYQARSVYKLAEIQKRYRPFHQGDRIVDLGCFPGSWSQYAIERVGGRGVVVGVDLEEPAIPDGTWITRSVFDVAADEIREALGGPTKVVMSDMAPRTTGIVFSDHVNQIQLARRALELALDLLEPGGHFIVKVFDGEEVPAYQADVRVHFDKLRRLKPEAVRRESREFYVLGLGFKGSAREG